MRKQSLLKGMAFLAIVFLSGPAFAGGISLYDFGSPDVGLAAAGYAARAQDAATVFTNPAGMSFLDKSQGLTGVQFLYGDVEFEPDSNTTTAGDDGGNSIGWMPGGSLFVVHKLDEDLSIGLGVLSYFGLGQDYDDSWVGRYYVQKGVLIGMTVTPAVSYRIAEGVFLGAGLNAMYGYMSTEVAINNFGDALPGETPPDGQLDFSDREWGYGGNFGILVEPKQGTRLGLTYLTEVKLDFSDTPGFTGLGSVLETVLINRGLFTSSLSMDVTVPQMLMFSVYQDLNDRISILANLGWQDWSDFGKMDIGISSDSPQSLSVDNNYKDTWHWAVGAQYRHTKELMFTCGMAYDSTAVDSCDRTVTVPMGEAWRFAVGTQVALRPDLTLGVAYEYLWGGDMSVDQYRGPLAGRVSGKYDNVNFDIFAFNLAWKY